MEISVSINIQHDLTSTLFTFSEFFPAFSRPFQVFALATPSRVAIPLDHGL